VARRIQQRVPAWLIAAGVCLALVGSALAPVAPASAQTLLFDVGVNFPEYVILFYRDQINIQITTAALTSYLFGQSAIDAGTKTTAANFVGNRWIADAGIDAVVDDDLLNDPDDPLWLGVPNGWAIESVSLSGDTQVSISVRKKDGKLAGPGGNRIRVTDAEVAGASSRGSTIVVPSTGAGGILWGEIFLQVDISRANRAGDYDGIVVQILAENI